MPGLLFTYSVFSHIAACSLAGSIHTAPFYLGTFVTESQIFVIYSNSLEIYSRSKAGRIGEDKYIVSNTNDSNLFYLRIFDVYLLYIISYIKLYG